MCKLYPLFKRFLDVFFSLSLLILLTPLFLVIVIIVKMEDGNSAFFTQKRFGKNLKPFSIYKFRTMIPNAEELLKQRIEKDEKIKKEWYASFKLNDDFRITNAGRFLRKYCLDELPQIFNILIGDMSFVGARPIVKDEMRKYGQYIKEYGSQRPGLTGMWQINIKKSPTYNQRIKYDVFYSKNISLKIDLMILFRTVYIFL